VIATPDQRVRVFVSSTLGELAAERAAARAAIERLRLTPVLFELGARPHPPRALYQAYLDQSDVFVGIYAGRYGWVAPGMEVSGLEDEYRLAASKPRLIYIREPAEREPRLQAMIEQIEADAAVSYRTFAGPDDLAPLIENDLALLLSERFGERPAGGGEDGRPPRRHIPAALDRFVGRERELTMLVDWLSDPGTRLVTVTGPGGVGKTRLALEVARRVQGGFQEAAHFVPLAAVSNAELVPAAIQSSLDFPAGAAISPLDSVIDGLRESELLLALDNFEHVLAAAPALAHMLEECPGLTLLITSRAVLKLHGERELPLEPLSVPTARDAEQPQSSEAVALFVERASAANPSFGLTEANADSVAEICHRLDGLPLGIELAASQVRVLPAEAILERLERRLGLGTSAAHAYPDRQRTLREAIGWSFELLDDAEKQLFARASVFRAAWTLGALEEVCGDSLDRDLLELMASLIENSLVRPASAEREPRFSMLETIKEYAGEKLEESGEAEALRRRHADFFVELAGQAGEGLRSAAHQSWLRRLDLEEDDVRSALDWLLGRGEADSVARAGWALAPYWQLRERVAEGREWMRGATSSGNLSPAGRGHAQSVAGLLAFLQGDYEAALAAASAALETCRSLDDEHGVALAQFPLGMVRSISGDAPTGLAMLEESHSLFERVGDEWGASLTMVALGWAANGAAEERPVELFEEAVARARRLGYEAETLALGALGRRRAMRGETDEAKRQLGEALRRVAALKARLGIAVYLEMIAALAAENGEQRLAALLSGAAEAGFAAMGAPVLPLVGDREARLAALRARLGEGGFAEEYEAGMTLGTDDAVSRALAWTQADATAGSRSD
jgi:predicted ATPase